MNRHALLTWALLVTPIAHGCQKHSCEPGVLETFGLRISRVGARGAGPEYELILHGDGRLEYNGIAGVDLIGMQDVRIELHDICRIRETVLSPKLGVLAGTHGLGVTDLPCTDIEIVDGRTHIRIKNCWFGNRKYMSLLRYRPIEPVETFEAIDCAVEGVQDILRKYIPLPPMRVD